MGLFRTDGKNEQNAYKKDERYKLDVENDKLQRKSSKLQRSQEVANEKLTRQQFEEKSRLEDEQAHGSLGDELEDGAIAMGQTLGLSQKTTTGFAMGAQDAKVNLFSSNEAIVEYYKNYDANREKKQQQVASVYSREMGQEQTAEKLALSEKQSKQTYKQSKKEQKVSRKINEMSAAENAQARVNKANETLGLDGITSDLANMAKDFFTLD